MAKTHTQIREEQLLICKKYAQDKGGDCLSESYHGTHKKLKWKCEFGHIWDAIASNVKSGKWCSTCSNNKKLTINDAIKLASTKDGYCLSDIYINSASLLIWKCRYGHIWQATYNNIKTKNCWCPQCSARIGEKICRLFFENNFDKKFASSRPNWLKGPSAKLELDGFNEELKIAFEYQGLQHYKIDGFFIKTQKELNKRIRYDKLKLRLCKENNITLIIIPQFKNNFSINEIINTLTKLLNENKLFVKDQIALDINQAYCDRIDSCKLWALKNNGLCLSEIYISAKYKLKWRCENLHEWEATPNCIQQGKWCPFCAKIRRYKY